MQEIFINARLIANEHDRSRVFGKGGYGDRRRGKAAPGNAINMELAEGVEPPTL
jgi:hypothetical protein